MLNLVGVEEIAVADDRHRDRRGDFRDRVPVCRMPVARLPGAPVDGERAGAGIRGRARQVEVIEGVAVTGTVTAARMAATIFATRDGCRPSAAPRPMRVK
jgi:hypothetical protein